MAIPKQERQDIRLLKRKQLRWERRQITVEGKKAILELLKSTWTQSESTSRQAAN